MSRFSIKKTDTRERRYEDLKEATGEGHTSKALDAAAKYYLRMAGGTTAVPNGRIAELLSAAEERGNLTAGEIAEILDTDELPVEAETRWSVGEPDT